MGENLLIVMLAQNHSSKQESLTIHKRIHSAQKTFNCPQCAYFLKTSGSLTGHKQTHTNKKPYLCSDTGKMFL